MDAWILILLSIFLGLALKFLLSNLLNKSQKKKKKEKRRLPPGPAILPILGGLLWLRKSLFDIEPILRQLRAKYGPIFTLRITSQPSIFITDRHLAHQALIQKGAAFAHRPASTEPNLILSSNQHNISSAAYGPLWRLLRRNLMSEILHPSRVKSFAPAREWVLNLLIQRLIKSGDGGVVVALESFQYAVFCLLVLMCFGEKLDEKAIGDIEVAQRALLLLFNKLGVFAFLPQIIAKFVFRGRWNALVAMRRKQEELFIPLIRSRKQKLQQQQRSSELNFSYAYIDSLFELQLPEEQGRKLSEDEIVTLCSEFLSGGTDTTSTALQWIMANLVKQQSKQKKLFEEIVGVVGIERGQIKEEDLQKMPYLKAVILEGLRRHPPGHFVLPHAVTEEVTLDGYLIPKDAIVNFTVAEMGLDEKVWEEPMEFKPERFMAGGEGEGVDITGSREIKMMPFGAGRRICPGLGLAMLHLEYFVANLVKEFEWKGVEGEEVDMSEKLEFTVVMNKPLRAQIFQRQSRKTNDI